MITNILIVLSSIFVSWILRHVTRIFWPLKMVWFISISGISWVFLFVPIRTCLCTGRSSSPLLVSFWWPRWMVAGISRRGRSFTMRRIILKAFPLSSPRRLKMPWMMSEGHSGEHEFIVIVVKEQTSKHSRQHSFLHSTPHNLLQHHKMKEASKSSREIWFAIVVEFSRRTRGRDDLLVTLSKRLKFFRSSWIARIFIGVALTSFLLISSFHFLVAGASRKTKELITFSQTGSHFVAYWSKKQQSTFIWYCLWTEGYQFIQQPTRKQLGNDVTLWNFSESFELSTKLYNINTSTKNSAYVI